MAESLISHRANSDDLEKAVVAIRHRIHKRGDQPDVSVQEQLEILEQMQDFALGRFLLLNQGLNGYWTHYICNHPNRGRITGLDRHGNPFTELEDHALNRFPSMLATQERFGLFQELLQKEVGDDRILASVPCGFMNDLLGLDYTGVTNCPLIGIDLDVESLDGARELAVKKGLERYVHLRNQDAWQLDEQESFSVISSNGLNIYEEDDKRVVDLYRNFYKALKPNGKLITSFLTPPPTSGDLCPWEMSKIDPSALRMQKIFFADVLEAKWQCCRTEEQTRSQLEKAGFKKNDIHWDRARIFPTVVAQK